MGLMETVVVHPEHQPAASLPVPAVPPPTRRGRVLLVEDNLVNQRVATLMLERLGCQVDLAVNGREAVERAARLPYDLIFMDCQMPDMDGCEATRRLRAADGRRIPIVAMTAHTPGDQRDECLRAGMDDFLTKPLFRHALDAMLTRWLPPGAPVEPSPATLAATIAMVEEHLHTLTGGGPPDFAVELLDTFLATAPRQVADLESAVRDRRLEEAARLAHQLRGSFSTLGLAQLAGHTLPLEQNLIAADMSVAAPTLQVLLARYAADEPALTTLRNRLAAVAAVPECPFTRFGTLR